MSTKDFYKAFEDKHRGSRELIKERVQIYLPFIKQLKKIYPDGFALDIGCGRGEWLELLKEHGISAKGIDFDEGMLRACHALGLDVIQGEGLTYLQAQPDESLMLVSAFHVVEHISFEALQNLVQEALRVLKPGGILLLETPNPENIKVATENFYLDPTHLKPIPSALLSFLPEFYGFSRTKILRVQESKDLIHQENINLEQVIEGVSPDYAVIAQKEAEHDILAQFNELFTQNAGLSLTLLANKFERRLQHIEAKAVHAEAQAIQAEEKATRAEAQALQTEANYHLLLNSNSWRVTKPLRLAGKAVRWFLRGVKHWLTFSPSSRPRRIMRKTLIFIKHHINANPKLKTKILRLLNHFPGIKTKLKSFVQTQYSPDESFINKYQFEAVIPRTDAINRKNEQNLSVDDILKRIESEINKQEKKDD